MILIFILPFAHTMTLRLLAIFIPAFLWLLDIIVKKDFRIKRTAFDLPVLFLLVWGLLSTIFSVDIKYSFKEYRGDMLIGFLLLYSSINNIKERTVERILDLLVVGAVVVSIYGILEYKGLIGQMESPGRVDSITPDYNYFSTYLILVLPILFYRFYMSSAKMRAIYFSVTLIAAIALILTFTRAAWIAAFAEIALFGIFINRKVLIILFTVVIMSFIIMNFKHMIPITTSESLKMQVVHPAYSYTDRMELWRFGIMHLKDRPVFGFGYGRANFARVYPEFFKRSILLFHTHNTFINIGLELGIPGLIALLWLFWVILKSLWKDWKDKLNENKILSFAIFVSVVGFLVRIQLDHLLVDEMALMLWLLVGIGFAISNQWRYRIKL
ncbi:MAG: O-antigen ligase family protein [Nitrospirae bacterium]|nr:O-antigen ligase family protein [Nitrospirota bacterium]